MMQCADKHSFQFNKKKLLTSFPFEYDEMKVDAGDPQVCKWIGKIIYPPNLELEHTQIHDEKQAFFTVRTHFFHTKNRLVRISVSLISTPRR
jgi:hypothetical protein